LGRAKPLNSSLPNARIAIKTTPHKCREIPLIS